MNILTNVSRLAPTGGVELNVYQIAEELARRGHGLNVVYQTDGELGIEYRRFCRELVAVPEFEYALRDRHPVRTYRQIRRAVRDGRKLEPDVVYVQRFHAVRWAISVGQSCDAPVVCHVHGFGGHTINLVNRLFSRGMSRMIAVSEFVRNEWEEAGISGELIEVVHNGIDPEAYPMADDAARKYARMTLGIPEDAFVVLYCGRIVFEKGVHVLIDAWRSLELHPDEGRLVLLGSAQSDDYSDALRRSAPTGGIHWLGLQKDVVLPMHAADVTVIPSLCDEGFGRVAVEAMATGCPVVASRVGGIPEILTGPFERLLVDKDNLDQLAKVLRSLIEWRRDRPDLGTACRAHVMDNFTLSHTVDGVERNLLAALSGACR